MFRRYAKIWKSWLIGILIPSAYHKKVFNRLHPQYDYYYAGIVLCAIGFNWFIDCSPYWQPIQLSQ